MSRFPQRNQDKKEELQGENGRIFHHLQNSLTSASLANFFSRPSHLHQVFLYGIYVLPQLREFWDLLQSKQLDKSLYIANIGGMKLTLHELQVKDKQARKAIVEHSEGWDNIDGLLHYQGLPYVPEIMQTEFISRNHDNPLAGHFGIEKTRELISREYYWLMLCNNIQDYVKGCNVCLASKAVWYKPYGDLQSLPIPTHCWKILSMDFVTGLPVTTDWTGDNYDSILVIVNRLIKMVHYKSVMITINASALAKVMINVVVRHHGLSDSIVTDKELLFTSKLWSLVCYFLDIKRRLSTAFYPQMNSHTEKQNSIMEAYIQVFVNFEQNH